MTTFKPIPIKGNIVNLPQKAEFSFTFNRKTKTPNCPKRKIVNRHGARWRVIKNKKLVIHPIHGLNYALWRLKKHMESLVYTDGTKVWKCDTIMETRKGKYDIYYLTCCKIKQSIHGV